MVFHSFVEKKKKNEAAAAATATQRIEKMASSTAAKSQPLHNFSLPDLKWAMNQTNSNRFRKLSDSSHKSPPPSQNDATDSDSDKCRRQNQNQNQNQNPVVLVEAVKTEKSVAKNKQSTVDEVADKSEKKPAASSEGSRSKKIFIRIRRNKNCKVADEVVDAGDHNSAVAEDAEESGPKTWNLRPRKLVTKANHNNNNNNVNGGALKIGGAAAHEIKDQAKVTDKKEKEKEKKQKFSISLSKEEIEDDFFTMTGSKPSRRPKKRTRNVQKQLDYVFPGLWLASITPESYRVNDGSTKG